jgi:hypothetical protein
VGEPRELPVVEPEPVPGPDAVVTEMADPGPEIVTVAYEVEIASEVNVVPPRTVDNVTVE